MDVGYVEQFANGCRRLELHSMGQRQLEWAASIVEEQLDLALAHHGYPSRAQELRLHSRSLAGEQQCWLIPGPDAESVLVALRSLPGYGFMKSGYRLATDATFELDNPDGSL